MDGDSSKNNDIWLYLRHYVVKQKSLHNIEASELVRISKFKIPDSIPVQNPVKVL